MYTLDNFRKQLSQIDRLGPLQKVMGRIPGMSSLTEATGEVDPEQNVKHLFGIIDSMTPEQRCAPSKFIDGRRCRRIAAGAGVEPHEVNELIKQFDAMVQIMVGMAGKRTR